MNWTKLMYWWGSGHFGGWDFKSVGSKNRYQGSGRTNYPKNHNCKKAAKAKAKNRASKKTRKRNRRK